MKIYWEGVKVINTVAKEKTHRHFNETADDYVNSYDGRFVQPMYTSLINELEHINSGKLLDVGCGNGDFFGLIKEKGLELYGIDLAENMVKAAQKKYGDIAVNKWPMDAADFQRINELLYKIF